MRRLFPPIHPLYCLLTRFQTSRSSTDGLPLYTIPGIAPLCHAGPLTPATVKILVTGALALACHASSCMQLGYVAIYMPLPSTLPWRSSPLHRKPGARHSSGASFPSCGALRFISPPGGVHIFAWPVYAGNTSPLPSYSSSPFPNPSELLFFAALARLRRPPRQSAGRLGV